MFLPPGVVTAADSAHVGRTRGSVGCVWGHLPSERALRVAWPGPNLLGPRYWNTCLCRFCDLSVFSAVVSDFFMFCICIRNHWHFWSTSQVLPVASFLPVSGCYLSWLCSGGSPPAFGELLGLRAGRDCQETTGSSERTWLMRGKHREQGA